MRNRPVLPFLCVLIFMLSGCASMHGQSAKYPVLRPALTNNAKLTYNYLLFLDQELRLRHYRKEGMKQQPQVAVEYQQRAAAAIDEVIRLRPAPELYMEKAVLFWSPSQIAEARIILRQGLKRYPGDKNLSLWLARSYAQERRYQDAADAFESYLTKYPDDVEARVSYAESLLLLRKPAEALDELNSIPAGRRTLEVTFLMSRAEFALGRTQLAVERLRGLLKKYPDYLDAWIELAYELEQTKDYAGAEDAYNALLEMGIDSEPAILRLISLNLKLNNLDKALSLAVEHARTEQFVVEAANLFISEQFSEQADIIIDLLAQRDPIPQSYYYYKALLTYIVRQDGQGALNWLAKIDKSFGKFREVRLLQMDILEETGQYETLQKLIEQERKENGNYRELFIAESHLYSGKGDYQKALDILEAGLAQYPDDKAMLYSRGYVYEIMGQQEKALQEMEYLITIDPENSSALNYVGYTLAEQGKELERALVFITSALRQQPSSPHFIDSLAWVYFKMGKLDKAWEQIQRASGLSDDPILWEHYGDIAAALGKNEKALKAYEKSIEGGHHTPASIQAKIDILKKEK